MNDVWLLIYDNAVLGVYATVAAARLRAAGVRESLGGVWSHVAPEHLTLRWYHTEGGRIYTLEISHRKVEGVPWGE